MKSAATTGSGPEVPGGHPRRNASEQSPVAPGPSGSKKDGRASGPDQAAAHRRNHSAFGSKRERQVAQLLRAEGWVVFHNKASRGVCDLVALRVLAQPWSDVHEAHLIEVKGTTRSPWVAWGPRERQELRDAARQAGAVPMLAWWPPHSELQWIGEAEWPG
jgi:Holliday junction resolvase